MADHTERRRKIFVDVDVQAALLRQLAFSWLVVLFVVASVLLAVESYKADFALGFFGSLAAMWRQNAALIVTITILAPFIIYDSVRSSHRFAGPMVSLRRALRELGDGQKVDTLRFRKNDFLKDIAESFNRVAERMNRLETNRGVGRTGRDDVHDNVQKVASDSWSAHEISS